MIGLAILLFLTGAALLFFAFNPKLSFFLEEGWKFRDKTEPSELYIGVNFLGRFVLGVVGILAGIGCLVAAITDANTAEARANTEAAAEAAHQRCEDVLLPRFNDTIEWDGAVVANPDEVRALARELGVEVEITRRTDYVHHDEPADDVDVKDPANPRTDKTAVFYIGGPHSSFGIGNTDKCFSYTRDPR